jgi:hypothetical protein
MTKNLRSRSGRKLYGEGQIEDLPLPDFIRWPTGSFSCRRCIITIIAQAGGLTRKYSVQNGLPDLVGIEVGLLDTAVRDLAMERHRDAEDDRALDLGTDGGGIDDGAANDAPDAIAPSFATSTLATCTT